MLKIKLKAEYGKIKIDEYNVSFPFSIYHENNDGYDVYWNLNSIECKNIQGSFRILYCYKIDITNPSDDGNGNAVNNNVNADGVTIKRTNTRVDDDLTSDQHLLFSEHTLLYINERDVTPSLQMTRQKLSRFLLRKEINAQESIQFFLHYDDRRRVKLKDEEIIIFINLYLEK